jgi:hypothetical protein
MFRITGCKGASLCSELLDAKEQTYVQNYWMQRSKLMFRITGCKGASLCSELLDAEEQAYVQNYWMQRSRLMFRITGCKGASLCSELLDAKEQAYVQNYWMQRSKLMFIITGCKGASQIVSATKHERWEGRHAYSVNNMADIRGQREGGKYLKDIRNCLVSADVRERLSVSKRATQTPDMDTLNLK